MFKCENIDYYTAFEGEPEITFEIKLEKKTFQFKIWIGYFESILNNINLINPKENKFFSLYCSYEGWFLESPFQIKDVNEVIYLFRQFKIDKLKDEERKYINNMINVLDDIKNDLIDFLEFSIINGYTTTISYC